MDLRQFLDQLRDAGQLLQITKEIPLHHIGAILANRDTAVYFERVQYSDMPVVGNVAASRRNLALAFGCAPEELLPTMQARLDLPPAIKEITDAPVKERVFVGDDVDLTMFPLHLQHEHDAAPYISCGLDVTHDEENGRWNIGMRRLMFLDRNHAGIDLVAPSDLMVLYRRRLAQGKPLDIAFLVGVHPLWQLASLFRSPIKNEMHFLSMITGQPVETIRCETIDLAAPAAAEIILEGRVLPAGYEQIEGPYGEFMGPYGVARLNPVVEFTAITCRARPIFQTTTIAGAHLANTDTSQLSSVRAESVLWETLKQAVQEPVNVYCPAAASQNYAVASIRKRFAGEGKNALMAMLSCKVGVKKAVVVDEDIDPFDHEQVDWAIATRVQANRDVVIPDHLRAIPIDPSLLSGPPYTTSKLGIDATRPSGMRAERFAPAYAPYRDAVGDDLDAYLESATERLPEPTVNDAAAISDLILRRLAEGPATYFELLEATPGCNHRLLLSCVAVLTQGGNIDRDDSGRFICTP